MTPQAPTSTPAAPAETSAGGSAFLAWLYVGIPLAWGIVASASIVMIYTLLGGMWSISITDFLHNLIIILALLSLIFIARNAGGAGMGWGISAIVVPFTLFMNMIELLVAFLQAFIFTLLTSMYIGSAIEDSHEADHGIGYSGPGEEIG